MRKDAARWAKLLKNTSNLLNDGTLPFAARRFTPSWEAIGLIGFDRRVRPSLAKEICPTLSWILSQILGEMNSAKILQTSLHSSRQSRAKVTFGHDLLAVAAVAAVAGSNFRPTLSPHRSRQEKHKETVRPYRMYGKKPTHVTCQRLLQELGLKSCGSFRTEPLQKH